MICDNIIHQSRPTRIYTDTLGMPNENIYKPFLKRKKLDIMLNEQYVNPVNKFQLINSATTSIFCGKNILFSPQRRIE